MLSHPIDVILFDLDGTLRHSVPSADDIQFRLANELYAALPASAQNLGARWAHYYWAQSSELLADKVELGDVDSAFWVRYLVRYLEALGVSARQAAEIAPEMAELMQVQYQPENVVYPCVPETLETLREAGFKLGLVSNRTHSCSQEIMELGLEPYFEFAYVAAEVQAWKPDPRIFDHAIQLSAAVPENTLYVGDNYYADIIGAQRAGFQAVLLDEKGIFQDEECVAISRVEDLINLVLV